MAIYLSRTLRLLGRYHESIKVLDAFIKTNKNENDLADAYYNMACYYSIWYGDIKDPQIKKRSIEALKKSISHDPQKKDLVVKDEDFFSIKSDQEFLGLLSNE